MRKFSEVELRVELSYHRWWLLGYDCGQRANLRGANLRWANLFGADLRDADLRDADLRGADLRGANLRDADLRWADLGKADLRRANLRGANLRGADLFGADLREANLRGANLRDADLRDADLRGANLRGANLRGADLRFCKGVTHIISEYYSAYIYGSRMRIGCEDHEISAWKSFSDYEIARMAHGALSRWTQNKGWVLAACDAHLARNGVQ